MVRRSSIGYPRARPAHLTKHYNIEKCAKRRTREFPLTKRDLVELITAYRQQGPRYQKQYRQVRGTRRAPSRMKRVPLCQFAARLQDYSDGHDGFNHSFIVRGPSAIHCGGSTQLCGNSCIPLKSRKGRAVHCKRY